MLHVRPKLMQTRVTYHSTYLHAYRTQKFVVGCSYFCCVIFSVTVHCPLYTYRHGEVPTEDEGQ